MADKKENKLLHGLKAAGNVIKRSPKMARKKIGEMVGNRKRMGGGKEYSNLSSCHDNGWLHDDDAIRIGVKFNVKYLGSMEIQYIPSDPHANNELAIDTMRKVKQLALHHDKLVLDISSSRVTLTKEEDQEVVMRHATSRIAYSTVDHKHPQLFAYVALPKSSKMSLCHVFDTKSAKKSYELTFTCAQAFDANYSEWQATSGAAAKAKAKKSKEESGKEAAAVAEVAAKVEALPLGADTAEEAAAEEASDEAYLTIESLEIEDEESMAAAADEYFCQIMDAKSMPNLLDIGVDPEDYNKASTEEAAAE